jgi:hypothetical protein
MNRSIGLGIAFAVSLAAPALAGEGAVDATIRHSHAHHHMQDAARLQTMAPKAVSQVPRPGPAPVAFPAMSPYSNGHGDEDGLSRHIGDCNKGCIGGNPG